MCSSSASHLSRVPIHKAVILLVGAGGPILLEPAGAFDVHIILQTKGNLFFCRSYSGIGPRIFKWSQINSEHIPLQRQEVRRRTGFRYALDKYEM